MRINKVLNKLLMLGLISWFGIGLSYANSPKLSKQYSSCMDQSGGVTINMHSCIASEIKVQDLRLNTAYKALTSSLNSTRKKQLQQVQRTWLRYRDQNCNYYADPDAGSLARVNAGICLMQMTGSRATELENFIVTN